MSRAVRGLLAAAVLAAAVAAPLPELGAEPAQSEADWLAASAAFKLELHALAAEALMLQMQTPPVSPFGNIRSDRRLRIDARNRLLESLRSTNALLSMMEIAEHSDRGPRVREVLALWLDSARRSLADHRDALPGPGSEPAADTAAFVEELKLLWRRLDRAYADLRAAVGPESAAGVGPEQV